MISIDKFLKRAFLTQSKAIHDNRQTVTVIWMQRINQNGNVLGIGYFIIREYTHHKGVGRSNRIIAMAKESTRK